MLIMFCRHCHNEQEYSGVKVVSPFFMYLFMAKVVFEMSLCLSLWYTPQLLNLEVNEILNWNLLAITWPERQTVCYEIGAHRF